MPDVVIRDVPVEDLRLLSARADLLGLSLGAYLRRQLHREAHRTARSVNARDLREMGELLADLGDHATMSDAWS